MDGLFESTQPLIWKNSKDLTRFTSSIEKHSFLDKVIEGNKQYRILSNFHVVAHNKNEQLFKLNPEALSKTGKFDISEPISLKLLENDLYVADRTSPKEWEELGKPDLLTKATARVDEILNEQTSSLIDATTDAMIRDRFKIHL